MFNDFIFFKSVYRSLAYLGLTGDSGGSGDTVVVAPSGFVDSSVTTSPLAQISTHSASLNVNIVDFTVTVPLVDGKIKTVVDLWSQPGLSRLRAGRFSADIIGDLVVYFVGTPSASTTPPTFSGQAAIIGFSLEPAKVTLAGVAQSIGSAPISFTAGGMQVARLAMPPDVRTTTLTNVPGSLPQLVVYGAGNGFTDGLVCVTGRVELHGIGAVSFF